MGRVTTLTPNTWRVGPARRDGTGKNARGGIPVFENMVVSMRCVGNDDVLSSFYKNVRLELQLKLLVCCDKQTKLFVVTQVVQVLTPNT